MATTKQTSRRASRVSILGGGNIGQALARGLLRSGRFSKASVIVTRRQPHLVEQLARDGLTATTDNPSAVSRARLVVLAVRPQQLDSLLHEIRDAIDPRQLVLVSVASGVSIDAIVEQVGKRVPVIRAMPNMAVAIGESMTCLAAKDGAGQALSRTRALFDRVGKTIVIEEELMVPATALCACGVAFFLRAVRAASQGGIEIGFHSNEALLMAAQTAKGAAALMLSSEHHPESEIDKVTTPRGCTIAGLNQMEHQGFSSAMIKGIITSAESAGQLYSGK